METKDATKATIFLFNLLIFSFFWSCSTIYSSVDRSFYFNGDATCVECRCFIVIILLILLMLLLLFKSQQVLHLNPNFCLFLGLFDSLDIIFFVVVLNSFGCVDSCINLLVFLSSYSYVQPSHFTVSFNWVGQWRCVASSFIEKVHSSHLKPIPLLYKNKQRQQQQTRLRLNHFHFTYLWDPLFN